MLVATYVLAVLATLSAYLHLPILTAACCGGIMFLVYRDWCYMDKVEKHLHGQIKELKAEVEKLREEK